MEYLLLMPGTYKFGERVVVTAEHLEAMVRNTPMPMPIVVRHDASKKAGMVTRLVVRYIGEPPRRMCLGLFADVEALELVPAFALDDTPSIQEVAVTGVPGMGALMSIRDV